MAEQFPRLFGKYALLKSLARGGMGEIYLAATGRPGGLHKLCVIKKVLTEKTDRAKVNRFLDEAKVVLRLSHANLVSTFDAGDVDGELFIAMELVEGKDLREIWNRCVRTRTRIPVDVALVVVREIARALAYVHAYGGLKLVHRDVAPPNILLSYFGEVKLTDFGLARSTLKQEHTAPGVVFGRASYLAPEQARGEVADARTDVYSLGIVLWELLTGQPYLQLSGLDPVTSLSLVRNPKTQPPSTRAPWIAPELDAIVLRALAPDRQARFQSAEDLRRTLSDTMTRVTPRADTERVADFLRALYRDVVGEESSERDRLLAGSASLFPPPRAPEPETPGPDSTYLPIAPREPPAKVVDADADVASSSSSSASPPASPPEVTVVAAPPAEVMAEISEPTESLAASAQRVRAGSQARQSAAEYFGSDVPTTVWRKGRGPRGEDAAQTFVGRVIDSRYNIQHRIGEGGMGTVYAAEHVEIGKRVAVKILHRLFSGEEQLVERFKGEARAASRVGHPHIVDVTDFGTTEEGCAYFVMEYLEGMDLADVLVQDRRLPPARAVRIAVQICQALEAAHNAGVIHRDLKPENIFLVARAGDPDFVKVLDFGIARDLSRDSSRLTNPGMAMGTPEYMAPEQVMGRPADRRTDIYAVGALLYEMIMGVAPFKSNSEQEMLQAKRGSPEPLRRQRPDIPWGVDAVILRALSADPDRRPQTMAELEAELMKIAWNAPEPPSAESEARAAKKARRTPGRGAAEAGALGATGATGATGPGNDAAAKNDAPVGDARERRRARRNARRGANPVGSVAPDRRGPETRRSGSTAPAAVTAAPASSESPTEGESKAAAPTVAIAAPELEKLLHTTTEPSAPVADPAREADVVVPAAAALARPRVATSPYGRGFPSVEADRVERLLETDRQNQTAGPGVQVRRDREAIYASRERVGRRSGFVALAVVALLLGGGVGASSMAKNGPPGFARAWLARMMPGTKPGTRPGSSTMAMVGTETALAPATPAPPASVPNVPTPAPPVLPPSAAAMDLAGGTAKVETPTPNAVPPPPLEQARLAMTAGTPDDAIAVLRPIAAKDQGPARMLLADALVASGWNDAKKYRWATTSRKAREALALATAGGGPSRGAHALLGEALYALRDFGGALDEFSKALAETPRDQRLKRRVVRSLRQLRGPPLEEPESEPPSTAPEAASQQ